MEKEEIIKEVQRLLNEETRDLSRSDYKEVLEEINGDTEAMLNAMDEEDQNEE